MHMERSGLEQSLRNLLDVVMRAWKLGTYYSVCSTFNHAMVWLKWLVQTDDKFANGLTST